MWSLLYRTHDVGVFVRLTRCSWQETKVWKPGATPKPSWSMNGGSFWVWIWTLIPASNEVSSVNKKKKDYYALYGPIHLHSGGLLFGSATE